jgi:hypothetical protein
MNSAIRVMNAALQDKVKELRAGHASEHVAGLEELQVCFSLPRGKRATTDAAP